MSTFEITESSSFELEVALTDKDGDPLEVIDSVSWWVGKPKSETPIIEKQDVDLEDIAATMTLIIPAEANICSARKNEDRFVIVRVTSGSHVKHVQYEYSVEAMDTVPYSETEE